MNALGNGAVHSFRARLKYQLLEFEMHVSYHHIKGAIQTSVIYAMALAGLML